jgi:hypothetical protein
VLCVRNEVIHIKRALRDLISDGIEVVLIDHQSDDDTLDRARPFLGRGLLQLHSLPWRGEFNLTEQLEFKARIVRDLHHEWVLHVDADEWLHPADETPTLRGVIERADAEGFNALNFNEFVFVAEPGEDFHSDDYSDRMVAYYHFRPHHPRLMRAFKRSAGLDFTKAGGHLLQGEGLRLYPHDQVLRHYHAYSEEQGRRKYVGRSFAPRDLEKGWHLNRLTITPERLRLRPHAALRRLSSPTSRDFSLEAPVATHFWEWA